MLSGVEVMGALDSRLTLWSGECVSEWAPNGQTNSAITLCLADLG